MNLLLLMTTGMSLQEWINLGQFSREISLYKKLTDQSVNNSLKVTIYSYGYNESHLVEDYNNINVISKTDKLLRAWYNIKSWKWKVIVDRLWNLSNLFSYKKFFKSIDVIKTNQFPGALFGVILKFFFGKKLILRMGYYYGHIVGVTWRKQFIEKLCFSYADKIILTNKLAIDYISARYNLLENKMVYIPNGIDIELFSPTESKRKYDILYVGRISEIKNLALLLKAISINQDKGVKVLFIGSGELEEDLKNYANNNNINLSVIARVDNNELPYYYNSSKIFVLPSKLEGNPKVLLEAMSCGAAVLGTNISAISEVISHLKTGYICKPNEQSMNKAITIMLNDDNLRKSLGTAARERIKSNFSLDSIVDKELEVYKSIL
ncbi:glycosyltransferase family 1 protein [Candidatus Marinimicrobia bacterium MT.SAG.3]|nr:glycosyltransferase family 1 protein [Candidatus Marinimicrobia bacterium MT.SAG.3]